jgi:hypothetical protein
MNKFGEKTSTLFLKGPEAHKLHHEFTVAATFEVKKGQPVVLTTDGEVKPAASAADANTIVGYSVHNGKAGELVTITMKPFMMVYAKPNAALVAGPVQYGGQNTAEPEYASFVAATSAAKQVGFALDAADAANDIIRVALF